MQEQVGSGGWGVVFKAKYSGEALWEEQDEEDYHVAFKRFQLSLDGMDDLQKKKQLAMYKEFQHEVRVSGSLQHPRLVRLLGVVMKPVFGTVMEFMEIGDLYTFVFLF